ncbi:MAG: response regulator [Dehalococcoidales bacterium]|nr:response regulator [Dehalococcoidales bacterium]
MEKASRVLVVDDNIELLSTFAMILGIKGYQVDTATNGLEATQRCQQNVYDVVLMDISMPVMNGIDAARQITRMDPSIKILLMTAYAEDTLVGQIIGERSYTVLQKPLQVKELVECIEQIVVSPLVLLVDDDEALCQTFSKILWKEGFRVAVANSGEEALDLMKRRNYRMAFVDYKLPHMDGLTVTDRFSEINSSMKSVMITAYREQFGARTSEDLNERGLTCLYKPLDMNRLIRLMKEYCVSPAT